MQLFNVILNACANLNNPSYTILNQLNIKTLITLFAPCHFNLNFDRFVQRSLDTCDRYRKRNYRNNFGYKH